MSLMGPASKPWRFSDSAQIYEMHDKRETLKPAVRRSHVGCISDLRALGAEELASNITKSMAEAPDPKTFGSWEDAFQYPIAAVRGMERQLRSDIDSNRERLRSVVGYVWQNSNVISSFLSLAVTNANILLSC